MLLWLQEHTNTHAHMLTYHVHTCACIILCVSVCHSAHMEVQGQLLEIIFPPLTLQIPVREIRFLSVLLASALPAEPSCWPSSVSEEVLSAEPYSGLGRRVRGEAGLTLPSMCSHICSLLLLGELPLCSPTSHASTSTLHQALKVNNSRALLYGRKHPFFSMSKEKGQQEDAGERPHQVSLAPQLLQLLEVLPPSASRCFCSPRMAKAGTLDTSCPSTGGR